MSIGDIVLITLGLLALIVVGLYFLNRYAYKKMNEQQAAIERTKVTTPIFVIDKKKMKPAEANLPKAAIDAMPKLFRARSTYFVKAKVGAQIATLMCEKKVFEEIPVKKTVKIDLAGIYIVAVKSGRPQETEQERKARLKQRASLNATGVRKLVRDLKLKITGKTDA